MFLCSLARSKYCSIYFFKSLDCVVHQNGKIYKLTIFFLFLNNTWWSLLNEIWWFICFSNSQIILWVSISFTVLGLSVYILIFSFLLLFFAFFQFFSVVRQDGKVYNSADFLLFFFLLTITMSDCLADILGSICISKTSWICTSHSPRQIPDCVFPTCTNGGILFLHNFQWISYPSQSCLFYCMRFFYPKSFHLYLHITYNCNFLTPYLFLQ